MYDLILVTLDPIIKDSWSFKISANDFENGILVIASNYKFNYHRCRYFSNNIKAREWIDSLTFIKDILLSD